MFFRKNIILAAALVALAAGIILPLRAEVDVQAALTGVPSQSVSEARVNDASPTTSPAFAEDSAVQEKESIQNTISSISDIDRLFEETSNFFHRTWDFLNKSRGKIFVLFIGLVLSYLVAMLVNYLFHTIFLRFAKRTSFTYDDQLCDSLRSPITTLIFLIGACLSSLPFLSLCPPTIFTLIIRLFLVAAVADITWGLFRVIDVVSKFLTELATKSTNNIDDLLVQFIRKTAKTILVLVAVFLCGETILELNITALMTTAGIAGLAIAFAAKDTIANFLSSIMIILDKPFKIGDRIRTGTFDGIVEAVGFRSSRIRGLDGNLFIIPNYQLADTAIENVTARPNIRYIFDLTLVYGTSPENMRLARKILERLTGDEKYFMQGENAPAIVFSDFKDWALNINVKVWFNTTDWVTSQEWRNNLNLAILEEFNRNGLDFAFPTNTTVIAGDPAMPLIVKKND